jgi:hypothetical protein
LWGFSYLNLLASFFEALDIRDQDSATIEAEPTATCEISESLINGFT